MIINHRFFLNINFKCILPFHTRRKLEHGQTAENKRTEAGGQRRQISKICFDNERPQLHRRVKDQQNVERIG